MARYANHISGELGEIAARRWLVERGYYVFVPTSSHSPADLIGIKGREVRKFQVKVTSRRLVGGGYKVTHRRLKPMEVAHGVELMYVTPLGEVFIDARRTARRTRRRNSQAGA